MKNRHIAIWLAAAIILSLSACSTNPAPTGTGQVTQTVQPQTEVEPLPSVSALEQETETAAEIHYWMERVDLGENGEFLCYRYDDVRNPLTLVEYKGDAKDLVFPERKEEYTLDYIEYIAPGVFEGKDIETVLFRQGISEIGKGAFKNCSKLKRVTIEEVTHENIGYNHPIRIKASAFEGCPLLTEFALDRIVELGDRAFKGDAMLDMELPELPEEIGAEAFAGTGLTKADFTPLYTYKLGDRAFAGCRNLVSATFDAKVSVFGKDVFADCPLLTFTAGPYTAAWRYAEENGIVALSPDT